MLELNIIYAHLLIYIVSVWWHRKYIKITYANNSATSKAILTTFFDKMLVSNILYAHLLIYILSVWWHIKISKSLMRIILQRQKQFWQNARATWTPILSIRNYPWWSLWHKNTQNNCFIQVKSPFSSLKLVTLLLFEEILVMTSY